MVDVDPSNSVNAGHNMLARGLQVATNVALLFASICVAAAALHLMKEKPRVAPDTYEVGDTVDAITGLDFRQTAHTLLMVLRQDCRYCHASLPFYKALTAAVNTAGAPAVRLVVVSTDSKKSITYLIKP